MYSIKRINLAVPSRFFGSRHFHAAVPKFAHPPHFKLSSTPHPLLEKDSQLRLGDHTGLQQNHIWSQEELNEKMSTLYRHNPVTITDRVVNTLVGYFVLTLHFMSVILFFA